MATTQHLTKAPIKEAIIDIQVALPDEITVEDLDKGASALKTDYPIRNEINEGRFGIRIDKGQAVSADVEQSRAGYRYISTDGSQIVQFRLNGFTFSRLEPYQTWEKMEQEARKLWALYGIAANPVKILRVAVRYINVMRIPLPFTDFDEVLTAPPKIPEELPQAVSSFFTRIVIKNTKINSSAIVTQAFDTIDNDHVPITLDIDVFANPDFLPEETDYWDYLEKLRSFKNEVFFKSITKKTLELFE